MAKRVGKSLKDLESLIEKPAFDSQTANGTAHGLGLGWNKQPPDYPNPEAPQGGAWQKPRSNRTGE